MPRSIWKGSIAFGLVQIPVSLYPAEEPDELSFHMLDRRNFAPVGYERVNKKTGRKVDWKDIVKGYEHSKGEYVVLTDQDFEAANVEATHTIDISDFVDVREIDPMYFDKPYYVAPVKSGRKAYALLRETLRRSQKAGIAKVVIRTRQHIAALMPRGDALALMLLRFDHELREADELDLPEKNLKKLGVSPKELTMAEKLVDGMVGDWDPTRYHDEYRDDLLALIKKKAKAGEVNAISEEPKKPRPKRTGAQVIDLMALLQQSVDGKSNSGRKTRRTAKSKGTPRKSKAHKPMRKSA
ncbi:MAG TPA: Ku protein [Polyangiaceae bacterium]|nr:Ku protein [Polyangiaceae bacterium]